jgi:hypothetical protein
MEGFLPLVYVALTQSIHCAYAAKGITAKFKVLCKDLKTWARKLTSIKEDIADLNSLISLMDAIENCRDLYAMESSFRAAMKKYLATLLQ